MNHQTRIHKWLGTKNVSFLLLVIHHQNQQWLAAEKNKNNEDKNMSLPIKYPRKSILVFFFLGGEEGGAEPLIADWPQQQAIHQQSHQSGTIATQQLYLNEGR